MSVRVSLLLFLIACGQSAKGDESPLPDDDNGKADSFARPTPHGAIRFGSTVAAELGDAARYHAWTFEVVAPVSIELVTGDAGDGEVDTVLYLYRRRDNGTWGPYLARNDDHGNTLFSKLSRELPPGRYRALVKGYGWGDAGPFSLTVRCSGERGACEDIPTAIANQVDAYARGVELPGFPVAAGQADTLRVIDGLATDVVAKWRDPLTQSTAPDAPRFGANPDFNAFIGDGWQRDGSPLYGGSSTTGWLWTNHEYISNKAPTATTAASGQFLVLAKHLATLGLLPNDPAAATWSVGELDTLVEQSKREQGGSWMRVQRDAGGAWTIDRTARNLRYDSTSNTRLAITGISLTGTETDDDGTPLPPNVAPGITSDCSGGLTPWGTIITAEENVQFSYGELEAVWDSKNGFVRGGGFDPGANITPPLEALATSGFGVHSNPGQRHRRDRYGYLTEIDVGEDPGTFYTASGVGHRKLGALGRNKWENAAIATTADGTLIHDKPIVIYAGDDRRNGRIYKLVTKQKWKRSMSRAETRRLLDEGTVYVAHLADLDNATGDTVGGTYPTALSPGRGRWIELSVTSQSPAPNGPAFGRPDMTVGEALRDLEWNGIGGYPTDDLVRLAQHTAASKVGVRELNRPEDLEWNGVHAKLLVAFTGHGSKTGLRADGTLFGLDVATGAWDPTAQAVQAPTRDSKVTNGTLMVIAEAGDDPSNTGELTFYNAWNGLSAELWTATGAAPWTQAHVAANVDNLLIDAYGGVWFGTDGNPGVNPSSDAIYFLDLDPAHALGQPGAVRPTFGMAFRVAAMPSDAEATGPFFAPDMRSLFFSVQHPGEDEPSTWPLGAGDPLPAVVALRKN